MQEIRSLHTRDPDILSETIRDITGEHGHMNPIGDLNLLTMAVERMATDTYLHFSKEHGSWVFTDILDDDLVYQDFFKDQSFVVVERDVHVALARGIHYRFHKKVRP